MDNTVSCKTKMDANLVWQWRILHVRKHSGCPEPFHHSSKAGLDFNVEAKTQKKLDLQLVTNGVILEVCDFAKTVNKGEKHFITDILENNFNLRLENEQQRADFTGHILHKVKDLLRNPPVDDYEVFSLFDTSEFTSRSSHGQQASSERTTDNDGKHGGEFKYSQTSKEFKKIEGHPEKMDEQSREPSTKELKEDIFLTLFPYCQEIGLNLGFEAKQSLDPGLLTAGVMLELVDFTKELTASYSQIILDVLEHNFQLDLTDGEVKKRVWFQVLHLLKRRKHLTRGTKTAPEFKKEAFSFKTSPCKRPEGSIMSDLRAKRSRTGQSVHTDRQTVSQLTQFSTGEKTENHQNYEGVQATPDPYSDHVTHSSNTDHLDQKQTNSNISRKSESSCQMFGVPFFITSNTSSSLPTLTSNISFEIDDNGVSCGKEQYQIQQNTPHECDMEGEETGTENLWKLRANRVEQILPALNKEFSRFKWFRRFLLEFNIGFGPKQNISVDALTDCVFLKIAKFALAMNSSHQDFIMEILEYNFDLGLRSQHHRNIFACKIMNRIRQLSSCHNVVKFSDDVFELTDPNPSSNVGNQNVGCVIPEFSNISEIVKDHADHAHPPYLRAETKELKESVDLYTSCNKIGLKLHVKNNQPNKKLAISKLTNAAVMEIMNFAEKLCGTFEQICLDILRHNFDLHLPSEDSEPARNILAQIPAAMEQKNLSRCVKACNKRKFTTHNIATIEKTDYQNNHDVDSCSAGSPQAINMDQSGGGSTDIASKNEFNLKLWKFRANHIQRILSMPHEEHCPLYSYSRCKNVGVDFNVGSGIKQNLNPNLLTNGIMVELNTFATAMLSARKDFVTEILEYNFKLNLKNELSRSAFAHQTMQKLRVMNYHKKSSALRMNMVFDLPDVTYTLDPIYDTTAYCPKCYQERNKLHQDTFDMNQIHHPYPSNMADTVSIDANCTVLKPAANPLSTVPTMEDRIMDSYPLCKAIGLNLCVDKNYTKVKLDPHVLTLGIMNEVVSFAKKMCGTKSKIIHTLLEHNFNIGKKSQDVDLAQMFRKATALKDGGVAWFNEVFVIRPVSRRLPVHGSRLKEAPSMQRNEMKEIIKKRKLALQRKQEKATLPSIMSTVKSSYPICTEIGLDLDVTAKSGEKEKLDLNLLTRAVVFEIHKYATQKVGHYYPRTVFDILDCNFDLSSQHYRRWEFSLATASKIQTIVKQWKKLDGVDKVFKLPFIYDSQTSEMLEEENQIENSVNLTLDIDSNSESSDEANCTPFLSSTDISSCSTTINSNVIPPFGYHLDKRSLCQDEGKIQTRKNVSLELCIEEVKIRTENDYTCPLGESDLESDEVTDSENTECQDLIENPKLFSLNSDFTRESRSMGLSGYENSISFNYVSCSLPGVNSDKDPSGLLDEKGLCIGKDQVQPPRYGPDDFDMDPEETGTENLWKLRANRVEQILSALNKEFGPFNRSKKVGLEFNVGFGPKQNINADSLTHSVLLEIAKFALAINSSQQDFIMEILEYNFDLGFQSQQHRNIFLSEIMKKVRQLNSCEDVVKFSNEVFELPVPTSVVIMAKQSEERGITELSSISNMEMCDAPSMHSSHAETEQVSGVPHKSVDPHPCCREIGLKLHVSSQPKKKLDINKLSNGAMTEVTNFAEKLCGTFDQICLDILRHNLNCGLQSGDSDLAGNLFARIPAAIEQRNLSTSVKACKKIKGTKKEISMEKLDPLSNSDLDAHSDCFSQTSGIDRNVGSPVETEHEKELNLKLWILRANHIQRILTIPHEEHCPLYSYSRCKKLGIDFNVGSGIKQNLDPKLLTNGIMVEFNAFATALLSAKKHFVTEILEYNFNLNLKNELCRSAFGHQTLEKFKTVKSNSALQKKMLFELPDLTNIQDPSHDKTTYCPRCYQERNHKLCQNEYDVSPMHHSHPRDIFSADANCNRQKPATNSFFILSKVDEKIMSGYPRCKKIGLNLCVDIDKPKDKIDRDNLTRGIMNEVINFAKKLCGTKSKIISTLLDHNFNIGKQSKDIDLAQMFRRETARKDGGISWFSEVFVIRPVSRRLPGHENKPKEASSIQSSERKETIRQRKLALQMKEARETVPSKYIAVIKPQSSPQRKVKYFPFSTKIGLVLDVRSKSGEKKKLDLKLLTRAVVFEIHKFATQKVGQSYPDTVFDILDYNFDVSSQYYRRLEFSTGIASKLQTMVKQYRLKRDRPYKVFKLPFVFPPHTSQEYVDKIQQKKCKMYQKQLIRKRNEGRCVLQVRYQSNGNHISFVGIVKTNHESLSHDEDTQMDPLNVTGGLLSISCCSPLKGNMQFKEEAYDPYDGDVTPEDDTNEKYHPHYQYVATESNPWEVERLDLGEPEGSLGYSLTTTYPDFEGKIKTEPQNEGIQCYMLAEPQISGGHAMLSACVNAETKIKTELDTAVYLDLDEAAASQEYSIITIGDGSDITAVKEEQDNVLTDYHGVLSYTSS